MSRQHTTSRLAALLADGDWHPGPELAHELGVTRARISQLIKALRDIGLDVYAVNGRGYRLPQPLSLLDAAVIRSRLAPATAAMLDGLDVLAEVDSTNAWLFREQIAGTHACFAEYQAAGRGRRARAWYSPFAANLYFSVSHALTPSRAPLSTLSLALGVALAERLRSLGVAAVGVKWPNDLYVDGAKLAGILIEHRGEAGGQSRVVIGVGMNVSMQLEQAATVDQPWRRLADYVSPMPERNDIAAQLLDAVLAALSTFQNDGFEPFRARWHQLDIARDQTVMVDDGANQRRGIARGIAADGALQVEFDGQIQSVYAGEVSLRVQPQSAIPPAG